MPAINPIPEGFTALTPTLTVEGGLEAIEFYKKAFGAETVGQVAMHEDGTRVMHATMKIRGAVFMLADDYPEWNGGKKSTPTALGGVSQSIYIYTEDCDATVKQAEAAGATVVMPPADMFWGDRFASITDPFGHRWSIATHIANPSHEEMAAAMAAMGEGQ